MAQPPHDGSIYASRPVLVDLSGVAGGPARVRRRRPGVVRPHAPPSGDARLGARCPPVRAGAVRGPARLGGRRLRDLPGLLAAADVPADAVHPDDARQLADAAAQIVATAGRMLERVRSGELATPPARRRWDRQR